jgi:hypothetical protein
LYVFISGLAMPRQNTEDSEVPQRRIAPNGYKLPTQLPEGIVVTDVCDKQWRIGKPIGLGGFGEIYLGNVTNSDVS